MRARRPRSQGGATPTAGCRRGARAPRGGFVSCCKVLNVFGNGEGKGARCAELCNRVASLGLAVFAFKVRMLIFAVSYNVKLMHTTRQRRMAARFLLLVFATMLLLASVHHHETEASSALCEECVHHQPHGGHLQASPTGVDNCVLCQFLSLSYVASLAVGLVVIVSFLSAALPCQQAFCQQQYAAQRIPRAPPFSL